jgi:hypothetical protein
MECAKTVALTRYMKEQGVPLHWFRLWCWLALLFVDG